jgi:hypothetical protein
MRIAAVAIAVAAALLAGCASSMHSAYSQPYVQFEAEHNQNLKGLFAATVTGVDGQPVNAGSTPPFPPGLRTVQVEMRAGQSDGYRAVPKTLQVDAKACTRYYIASKRTADGFEPVVSTMERIKECENLTAGKSGGM